MTNEYYSVPSWKLVLLIKDCKTLLRAYPNSVKIKNTLSLLKNIMIQRQVRI